MNQSSPNLQAPYSSRDRELGSATQPPTIALGGCSGHDIAMSYKSVLAGGLAVTIEPVATG
jgi:hypothetical protein